MPGDNNSEIFAAEQAAFLEEMYQKYMNKLASHSIHYAGGGENMPQNPPMPQSWWTIVEAQAQAQAAPPPPLYPEGKAKFGLPPDYQGVGYPGLICSVCGQSWENGHDGWNCQSGPLAGGPPTTQAVPTFHPSHYTVTVGGTGGHLITTAHPSDVGPEEEPYYDDDPDPFDDDDEDDDHDEIEGGEPEPPEDGAVPLVHHAPSKKPGPSWIASKEDKIAGTRKCSTCGNLKIANETFKTKDGLHLCARCVHTYSKCSFCGWQCPIEEFEAKVYAHLYCPDCAPQKKMKLNVKQQQQFTAKSDILKDRREKVWSKIQASS